MLNNWNNDTEKMVAIVIDTAKNMVNTINFPCISHTLLLGVKKALDVPKLHTTLAQVRRLVAHFHRSKRLCQN